MKILAVGNGYACDNKSLSYTFHAYREEAGKVSVLGRHELVSGLH